MVEGSSEVVSDLAVFDLRRNGDPATVAALVCSSMVWVLRSRCRLVAGWAEELAPPGRVRPAAALARRTR